MLAGGLGVGAVLVPMFVIVSSLSFVLPNSTALALADHAAVAGTASALLGACQFLIGALVAPLVGAGGTESAVPMAAIMTAVALAALATRHVAAGAREAAGMTLVTVAASYGAGGSRVAPALAAGWACRSSAAPRSARRRPRRGGDEARAAAALAAAPRWPSRGGRRPG